MVLALALSCGAYAMILTHNHPSGRTYPSESDKEITKQFADAAKLHDIKILDHIIVSQESYYSFADEGEL
jgi:DNA repair protein RadC